MSRTVKVVNIVVLAVWIALIAFVLYREFTGTTLEKQLSLRQSFKKTTYWYDIYMGTKKIGFASYIFEWVGDEIIIKYDEEVKFAQGDEEGPLVRSFRCLSNSSYAIKTVEYSSSYKGEKGIRVAGETDSDGIVFFLETPQKRKTYRTSTGGRDVYLPTTFVPAVVLKRPSAGSAFVIPVLDIENLSVTDARVVVEEIRPVKLGAQVASYYKLRMGDRIFWSDLKGITVKEEYPQGITLYRQTEALAKNPKNRVLFDPFSLSFVKSNKILEEVEKLKMFRVRIKGFPLAPALYERSGVIMKNDTLTIQKEDPEEFKKKSYPLPDTDTEAGRYLAPDEWVLSDDKTVKGNALNMASVEKNDAFRLARYLTANLYFTVKTMPLFVLTNSADIFDSKSGDHLQRAVMFTSFARAAGLPVRMVGGMVYRDGYFYFHTWPEAWFGKWIPVDPTLAQFPADVTHIPLAQGSLGDIAAMAERLRSVNIEVLEAL
jgi:hypothetical protein